MAGGEGARAPKSGDLSDGDAGPGNTLAALLAGREESRTGATREARVSAWRGSEGVLADGMRVRRAASCLAVPGEGDLILAWVGAGAPGWVLAVLERGPGSENVHALEGDIRLAGPRIRLEGENVHLHAGELLENVRDRHEVSETHTEVSKLRVAHVGTDVRNAGNVRDEIAGSLVQHMGVWFANAARELRMHAKAMLFD